MKKFNEGDLVTLRPADFPRILQEHGRLWIVVRVYRDMITIKSLASGFFGTLYGSSVEKCDADT